MQIHEKGLQLGSYERRLLNINSQDIEQLEDPKNIETLTLSWVKFFVGRIAWQQRVSEQCASGTCRPNDEILRDMEDDLDILLGMAGTLLLHEIEQYSKEIPEE